MTLEPTIKKKNDERFFLRLTLNQRIQHIVLILSFTILALTGMPMKYFDSSWSTLLFALFGGIEWAPIIHRVAAIVILLSFFYHIIYVLVIANIYFIRPLRKENRCTFRNMILSILSMPMIPNAADLREAKDILMYYSFISNKKPVKGRFGVTEKFGYWAVFWGMPILGITGFFLWAEGIVTRYLPGIALNISYIAHSDEALLAVTVIFIWHLYNTHISLSKFPMGMSWFTGYENEEEMMEEHYAHYVETMKKEGLGAEIKKEKKDHFEGQSLFLRMASKVFVISLMFLLTLATIFIARTIYQTTFGHLPPPREAIAKEKQPAKLEEFLEKIVLEDKDKERLYRGYRITMEKELKGYYHNIALKVKPDKRSHCILCHGDFPHGETKHIRAFLNMHNFYLACETCHIRAEDATETFVYRWYDIDSGDIIPNPVIDNKPTDELDIKLIPCRIEKGKLIRADSEERIKLTKDFVRKVEKDEISFEEEKEILKQIHDRVNPQSIQCQECHTRDKLIVPLAEIGYTERRIGYICSDEISRMIRDYKLYSSPTVLKTWEEK